MTSLILKKNYELLKIYDKGCKIYSLHSFNSMNFLKLEKENCLNLLNSEKQFIINIEQEFEENIER